MSKSKTDKILERVYADHAKDLINWASRRFKNKEDAEDLCQEVMSRFAKMVIAKEEAGEEIEKVDSYLWRIAYTLMDDYFRDVEKRHKLVQGIENELLVGDGHDRPASETDEDDNDTQMKKLRMSISQLDYNLREAMIMFHLEKMSLTEISKKLQVTEGYVKKLLHESRQIIKENERKKLYEVDRVFRPNHVSMSICGDSDGMVAGYIMSNSLSKQNICLACYDKACSVEELTQELGLPSAYIESDLEWLVSKNYMKKQKNRYSTIFYIYNGTSNARLFNFYFSHKEQYLDKIVDKLTALQPKIKEIGFIGADKPINQLLWLLIYSFTRIAGEQTFYKELGYELDVLNGPHGEKYYQVGIFSSESKIDYLPQFVERYNELRQWERNGPIDSYIKEEGIMCYRFCLKRVDQILPTCLTLVSPFFEIDDYKDLLIKLHKQNSRIDGLSEEEREKLGEAIRVGLLSMGEDGCTVVPNFYVFTQAQREAFDAVLMECYEEMRDEFHELYLELRELCIKSLPKQMGGLLDFVISQCLGDINFFTLGFAYYDGRLWKPEGDDFTLQTVNVVVN